ncbi:MAG: hypothetical protein DRI22_03930, partial [Caldiserica bacterium]
RKAEKEKREKILEQRRILEERELKLKEELEEEKKKLEEEFKLKKEEALKKAEKGADLIEKRAKERYKEALDFVIRKVLLENGDRKD